MITTEQIEQQIEFEREAINFGLKRLHKETLKAEVRNSASMTVYGATSIDTLLPLVVEEINNTIDYKIRRGHAGKSFKEIGQLVIDADRVMLASIACKMVFDSVFSCNDKDAMLGNVLRRVGAGIESELQMEFYETSAPQLYNYMVKNYFHASSGTKQKLTTAKLMMKRCGHEWPRWSSTEQIHIGGWLLGCITSVCNWFEKSTRYESTNRKVNYLIPTAELLDNKDDIIAQAELFSPVAWPMLIPPKPWSEEESGGYLLNEVMHRHKLVRKADGPYKGQDEPIQFINTIQSVPWTLNELVVGVAEHLQEQGQSVGKFVPIIENPLPPKPVDIATNKESRHAYNRQAAEVCNLNAQVFRRSCRTRLTMNLVEKFKKVDKFYCPWSFDYRGRAYPIPAFLTVQDTDFGKSLLRFAEESIVDSQACEWLAFHVATTYGLDKASMSERLAWTEANISLISSVATDPIGCLPEWEAAEEPWQFLAACDEYHQCVITKNRKTTALPVATDATCSGLQILAGLAKDASTAALVNVLPGDRPSDAYKAVAEEAKPHCPESVQPYLDRKVVKRVVMTVPYNAKTKSNRDYIKAGLKEKGIEISNEDLTATVTAVREAMRRIVPGPLAVMDWINKEVSAYFKEGHEELVWTTPSGFTVVQRLMKSRVETQRHRLFGTQRVKVTCDTADEIGVDKRHHINATAPNLIHSLDASLLHIALKDIGVPIGVIHDSVLARATDMSVISERLRQSYMFLFAENNYLEDFQEQIGSNTPPPMIGDLEPQSVINSTYFFC